MMLAEERRAEMPSALRSKWLLLGQIFGLVTSGLGGSMRFRRMLMGLF